MNEQQLQQAFIQWLALQTGARNEQELEAIIQQMGEQGLQQAYAQFMEEMQGQQQAQAMQMAKHGAKLNYIKSLRGQCPDGYEVSYFKKGGQLCKTCTKKQVTMEEGGAMPSDPVEAFKCGRKMKKKKCEAGAPIEMDKCGGKTKKKKAACGVKMDKCGDKMKKYMNPAGPLPKLGIDGGENARRAIESLRPRNTGPNTPLDTPPGQFPAGRPGSEIWKGRAEWQQMPEGTEPILRGPAEYKPLPPGTKPYMPL